MTDPVLATLIGAGLSLTTIPAYALLHHLARCTYRSRHRHPQENR